MQHVILKDCDNDCDDSQLMTLINSQEFCGAISNGVELVDDNHERDGKRMLTFEATTDILRESFRNIMVKETIKHRLEVPVLSYNTLRTIAYLVAIEVNGIEGNVFSSKRFATV